MPASLRAEALKLRRLWLPAIAAAAGLLLAALAGTSLWGAAGRLRTERSLDMPWQDGVVGDVSVSATLLLPTLVTLLTALVFFVEHRGDMWKQLSATPRPRPAILAAKFALIQALVALALLAALAAALIGWHLLPPPLHREIAVADSAAYGHLVRLAALLYLSLLPVAFVQFWLSARLTNIFYPVGIGLALTFACLILFGPATGRYLPYAWPGAAVIGSFGAEPAGERQRPDESYRPPRGALAGARAGGGAILVDSAHGNRHGLGRPGEPGSLDWLSQAGAEAGIRVRESAAPFSAGALAGVDLLVIGTAAAAPAPSEAEAVEAWVRGGGSLLLLTDHEPFASASQALAGRFGVGLSLEMVAGDSAGSNRRNFAEASGPAGQRLGPVRTYGGQALWRSGALRLLPLDEQARTASGQRIVTGAPAAQALAFDHGKGRIVVSGDSGLFGAQWNAHGPVGVNDRETGNAAFVLAVLRWLLRIGDEPTGGKGSGSR